MTKVKITITEYNCNQCFQRFLFNDGIVRTECPVCKAALHCNSKDTHVSTT